jgi:hypothetical protein
VTIKVTSFSYVFETSSFGSENWNSIPDIHLQIDHGDKRPFWRKGYSMKLHLSLTGDPHTLLLKSGAAQWLESFGYGLEDQAIVICFSAEARYVSLTRSVHTGYGAHPASCSIETKGSFCQGENGQDVNITTHIHLAQRSRKRGAASLLNSIL